MWLCCCWDAAAVWSGDLAAAFAKAADWGRNPDAQVWLSDINASMLGVGRDRLLDRGPEFALVMPRTFG